MIYSYGFSIVGKSHIAKGTCCQDAHKIKTLENGWCIAAVADGVGAATNSQIGSKIAADTVVDFCAECMPWDYSVIGIKSMLRTAYNYAFKQIIKESEKSGEPIESYDTTLTVVIYDGHRIIYGHSGDGAIIALTIYGDYVQVTKPQKGEDMVSVLPLRAGYTVWSIDSYEEELAAVMLMTDGMLDYTLCPYLLKLSDCSQVYTPIASFFADPYGFAENKKESKKIKEEIEAFIQADEDYDSDRFYNRLSQIYFKHLKDDAEKVIEELKECNYPIALMQSVQDDKTIVALINTEIAFESKDKAFFADPDWKKLKEEWNKKAYPHLYQNKENKSNTSDESQKIKSEKNKETISKNIEPVNVSSTDKSNTMSETSESKATLHTFQKPANPTQVHVSNNEDIQFGVGTQKKFVPERSGKVKHARPKKKSLLGKVLDVVEQLFSLSND